LILEFEKKHHSIESHPVSLKLYIQQTMKINHEGNWIDPLPSN
jgi:hypothetical protein